MCALPVLLYGRYLLLATKMTWFLVVKPRISGSTPGVWPTMLQSATCGTTVVLVDSYTYSVCRSWRESDITYILKLMFRLSVCYSQWSLFDPGGHSTDTTVPRNTQLQKILSHCRPVQDFAIMLSTISVAPTAESTMSLLSMTFWNGSTIVLIDTARKFFVDELYAVLSWQWRGYLIS